jgi:hypothetical protein
VRESKGSETAQPRKRRGRPPLPPGKAKPKRHPLTISCTREFKDLLVKASKASGRSLSREILYRLELTLAEDEAVRNPSSVVETRMDGLLDQIRYLLMQSFQDLAEQFQWPAPGRENRHSSARAEGRSEPGKGLEELAELPEPADDQHERDREVDSPPRRAAVFASPSHQLGAQLAQLTAGFAHLGGEIAELRRELRAGKSLSDGSRDDPTGGRPARRGVDKDQQHSHSDCKAPLRGKYAVSERGGKVAKLLPLEFDITLGEDGNIVLVSRDGGLVVETSVDPATALRIFEEARFEVGGNGEKETKLKRKSRRTT